MGNEGLGVWEECSLGLWEWVFVRGRECVWRCGVGLEWGILRCFGLVCVVWSVDFGGFWIW